MDSTELRNLHEAYLDVYENEQLDEISQKTATSAFAKRATNEFESDGDNPRDFTKSGKSKADETRSRIDKKYGKAAGKSADRAAHAGIFGRKSFSMPKESYDLYDIILSHLIDGGYAETEGAAESIMVNMSEEWRQSILDEGDNYDKNRQRAAKRAAERNAARDAGKTGNVPGVGYVTSRRERETYRDSGGVERHTSGARMPK